MQKSDIKKIRLYHLYKQNLLKKADKSEYSDVFKKSLGLHSTDYLTPYFSLWARVEDFDPEVLFNDINRREAVRLRAFRGTVFVIHRDSLENIIGASQIFFDSRFREVENFAKKKNIDLGSLEKRILMIISGKQLSVSEIKKELNEKIPGDQFIPVQRLLELKQVLTRSGQRYITDKVIKYSLTEEEFPDIMLKNINPEKELETLILKYIARFGPVTFEDLCWWLPVSKRTGKEVLENIKKNLISLEFKNSEYFMEKCDFEAFKNFKHPENDIIINFIPYEDHFPKAYKIRDWYISEKLVPKMINIGRFDYGQLHPSIWLNGEIIGRWEINWKDKDKAKAKVSIKNLNKELIKPKNVRDLIEKQRKELQNFINEKMAPLLNKPSG